MRKKRFYLIFSLLLSFSKKNEGDDGTAEEGEVNFDCLPRKLRWQSSHFSFTPNLSRFRRTEHLPLRPAKFLKW